MHAQAVASLPVGRVGHPPQAWLAWIALALAGIGGFVDAVGYLALFRLFTAHMRGNTASAGADLAAQEWSAALHSGLPVAMFVAGVCVGAVVKQEGTRRGLRSWFALSCLLECVLLVFGRGSDPAVLGQGSAEYFLLVQPGGSEADIDAVRHGVACPGRST